MHRAKGEQSSSSMSRIGGRDESDLQQPRLSDLTHKRACHRDDNARGTAPSKSTGTHPPWRVAKSLKINIYNQHYPLIIPKKCSLQESATQQAMLSFDQDRSYASSIPEE